MRILSGAQLAGGNSVTVKADNDFYATDPATVDIFMKKAMQDKIFASLDGKLIWECACGNGNIVSKITEYFPRSKVKATDLVYRGCGEGDVNFLSSDFQGAEMIITNPPFSLINDFIIKSMELTQRYVVFFAKIQVLETVSRKELLEKSPLKYIYMYILQGRLLGKTARAGRQKAKSGLQRCSLLGLYGIRNIRESL